MNNVILNELLEVWGPHKTAQVIAMGIIGACIGVMIGANIVGTDPVQNNKKENV